MANELTLVDKVDRLKEFLDKRMEQLAKALPANTMEPHHFARVVVTLCQRNLNLLECDKASLLGAVMQSAQLGLSPDPVLGEAWFVPFKGIVQFIPGYKGLVKLAWQSGQVSKIAARVVRAGDLFEYEYGLKEKLIHKPTAPLTAELSHVYAVVKIKGGDVNFTVMTRQEVDAIKARSPAARKGGSPWHTDYDAMAMKTVLRRQCKTMPTSVAPRLQRALALDEQAENGLKQHLSKEFADGNEEKESDESGEDFGALDEGGSGESGEASQGTRVVTQSPRQRGDRGVPGKLSDDEQALADAAREAESK